MPRKTKLTPALQATFVQALSVGATHKLACEYAGITQETFYAWLRLALKGKAPYSAFSEAITRAQGSVAISWLAKIEAAGADDWRAIAWKLERRFPEEYGRTIQRIEHDGVDGKPIEILYGTSNKKSLL